jgi:hypothetical protein
MPAPQSHAIQTRPSSTPRPARRSGGAPAGGVEGGEQLGHAAGLLDYLIRSLQERRRDRQAERLGGLEVDDQLELRGLLNGEIGGRAPLRILSM